MPEIWYQILIYPICYGIAAKNGKVTKAPPLASWMVGKTLQEIKPYLLKNRAKVTQITNT